MNNLKVEAIALKNIKDKELLYIKITDGKGNMATITVGKENYETVKKMLTTAEQPELPLPKEGKK